MTVALAYCAPAWKDQLQRDWRPKRRPTIRHRDNVAFLPQPVVGYRIRHDGAQAVVEIKPQRAPAQVLARCTSVENARRFLTEMLEQHRRPVLREIGRALA